MDSFLVYQYKFYCKQGAQLKQDMSSYCRTTLKRYPGQAGIDRIKASLYKTSLLDVKEEPPSKVCVSEQSEPWEPMNASLPQPCSCLHAKMHRASEMHA